MDKNIKHMLTGLVKQEVDSDLPNVPEHLLNMALGLDEKGSQDSQSSQEGNEAKFNVLASEALLEKADKLKKALFDGTLAVKGGIGFGFVAYDEELNKSPSQTMKPKK